MPRTDGPFIFRTRLKRRLPRPQTKETIMQDDTQAADDVRRGVDFAKLRAFRAFAADNFDA